MAKRNRAQLNPAHLQTFAVVAETGSLTQAGQLLDLGQSAISSQLRGLQSAMGAPLYRRSGHGVTLTPAGEALLPYAQEVARQVRLAQELMPAYAQAGPMTRQVRLGLCLTLGETLPPLILQACARHCPELHLDVVVAPTPELGRAVEEGELFLALAGGTPVPSASAPHALQVSHVATDRLLWVPPSGVGSGATTLREAARSPWLWAHAGSTVKSTVEQVARRQGLELPPTFVLGSYAAVRSGVQGGLGGAFLPRHHLAALAAGEALVGAALSDVDLRLPYQSLTSALHPADEVTRVRQVTLGVLDSLLG